MPLYRIECRLQKQAMHRIENKVERLQARNAEDAVRRFEQKFKHYHIARIIEMTNTETRC
jgi:hypothetical protein